MAPDDERLGRLIGAAFDPLPEPEPARLKAVEDRLTHTLAGRKTKRRAAGWYWWLMATLAVTGAAAWWGEGHLSREPSSTPAPQGTDSGRTPTTEDRIRDKRGGPVEAAAPSDQRPEIFRRERY